MPPPNPDAILGGGIIIIIIMIIIYILLKTLRLLYFIESFVMNCHECHRNTFSIEDTRAEGAKVLH